MPRTRTQEWYRKEQEAYVARIEHERREKRALDAAREAGEQCQVCGRDDWIEIEAKMRSGQPLGAIVELFDLDHASASRHRDHHLRSGLQKIAPEPEPEPDPWDALAEEMAAALEGLRQT